jgi:hypothetical protein
MFMFVLLNFVTGGQEIEFHEIKTGDRNFFFDQQNSSFFMRSKVTIIIGLPDQCIFHENESPKNMIIDFCSLDRNCIYKNVHEIESPKSMIIDFRSHDRSCIYKNVHEIESLKSIIFDF